ncbi:hypothetical protein BC829DRAFT_491670 [Chytridium lagenaria]|nr:hypothetical protein BC829DRAFT_491670 [Chytridium lagenaria]
MCRGEEVGSWNVAWNALDKGFGGVHFVLLIGKRWVKEMVERGRGGDEEIQHTVIIGIISITSINHIHLTIVIHHYHRPPSFLPIPTTPPPRSSPSTVPHHSKKRKRIQLLPQQRHPDGTTWDWRQLPLEIWLDVLIRLQPATPTNDEWWSHGKCRFWTSPPHSLSPQHQGESSSPPLLFLDPSVEAASFFHPFWETLKWHHLVPMRRELTDAFFESFGVDQRVQRVKRVYLDLKPLGFHVTSAALKKVFEKLNPGSVEEICVEVSWTAMADHEVLKIITMKFWRLSRLHLMGPRGRGVLFGLGDDDIQVLARQTTPTSTTTSFVKHSFKPQRKSIQPTRPILQSNTLPPPLTHLNLDGFGQGGFTWDSFRSLVCQLPHLHTVSLSDVNPGIDLTDLSTLCPNLHSLCISFTMAVSDGGAPLESPLMHPRTLFAHPSVRPMLYGDLRGFKKLASLTLERHPYMEHPRKTCDIPTPMVTALLNSCTATLSQLRVDVSPAIEWITMEAVSAIRRHCSVGRLGCRGFEVGVLAGLIVGMEGLERLEVGRGVVEELRGVGKGFWATEEEAEVGRRVEKVLERVEVVEM